MGFEGAFNRRQPSSHERSSRDLIPGLEKTLEALTQAQNALRSYGEHHPDISIDMDNPDNNSREVRKDAMMEWITSGSAAVFRQNIETGQLNESQASELRDTISDVRRNTGSIH